VVIPVQVFRKSKKLPQEDEKGATDSEKRADAQHVSKGISKKMGLWRKRGMPLSESRRKQIAGLCYLGCLGKTSNCYLDTQCQNCAKVDDRDASRGKGKREEIRQEGFKKPASDIRRQIKGAPGGRPRGQTTKGQGFHRGGRLNKKKSTNSEKKQGTSLRREKKRGNPPRSGRSGGGNGAVGGISIKKRGRRKKPGPNVFQRSSSGPKLN